MHRYLKSIGFQGIRSKKELKLVFDQILNQPDTVQFIPTEDEGSLCVLTKDFAPSMGIALCGEFNEDNNFELEYYYPYFYSDVVSTCSESVFKRQGEKESYFGSCDDYRVGITLIYYLSNFMDMKEIEEDLGYEPMAESVHLTALAEEGKILLPLYKTEDEKEAARIASIKRCDMIKAAKNGDKSAIEYLTRDEMRTYTHLNRNISKTDIYTLISSFFMPDGVECDQYAIMGEIQYVEQVKNSFTGETVYQMLLMCNDIPLFVLINQADLFGVPEEGRRFKGKVWLQAHADFREDY